MKVDYTGIVRYAYIVKHRTTGELGVVKLGEKYNQQEWDLLNPLSSLEYVYAKTRGYQSPR